MTEAISGLSLGDALAAVLVALGRPVALPDDDPQAAPEVVLAAALEPLGLAAQSWVVRSDRVPQIQGAAALVELAGGGWLPLLPRPGTDCPDLINREGGASRLPEHFPPLSERAFLVIEHVEPRLDVAEVRTFFRRNGRYLVPIAVGGLVTNLLLLVTPLFGSFVYDKVLGNGVSDTLWAMALGVLLSILLDFCARALRIQLVERVAVSSEGDIDRALFKGLLRRTGGMPPVGVVLDKYKQMLSSREFVSSSYLLAGADLPFVLLFLGCIALVSGPLVLVPLVCGGISLGLDVLFNGPAREYDRMARKSGEQRVTILADLLVAREAVVSSSWGGEISRRWRRASDGAAVAAGRTRFWNSLNMAQGNGCRNLAYIGIMVGGAYMVEVHQLTSGGMMAASMLTSRCMMMVSSVVLLATRMDEFRRAIRELDQMIPAGDDTPVSFRPSDPRGDIQLMGLSWKPAADGRMILQNIERRIRPGEVVGIAGLPGAGKTTLLRLIAGVERPSEGQVLLDMLPLEQWDQRQRARAIGYKPQEAILFDGTLESNIRAGNHAASTELLREALERSGLLLAIERGDVTLGTEVGPRGTNLSGGQRQMVALARALLGNPPILLLDEPSTGFDSQLEASLGQYLASLVGKRTVLVSTHSRALLMACTRILVIQGGRVVADGPREKVLVG